MADFHLLLTYLLLGSVVGVLAGLLGVGGGLVIVPVLLWAFTASGVASDVLVHLAVGSSLASIVITSLASTYAHHRHQAILWPVIRRLSPGIVAGALLGAGVAGWLPGPVLQRLFGGFAIGVALWMFSGGQPHSHSGRLPGRLRMLGAGALIGAVSAIVGIGGGSMTVPYLVWNGANIRNAVATSAACGVPIALAGSLGFAWAGWQQSSLPLHSTGFIHWPAVLGITATSMLTARLGARLAHSAPTTALRRVFALLLLGIGAKLALWG